MRIRRSMVWLYGAAGVFLVLVVVWFANQPAATPPVKGAFLTKTAEHTPAPVTVRSETNAGSSSESSAEPATAAVNAATLTPTPMKAQTARAVFSTLNDVPIDFYGRLQDQFGNPVASAEITGSIICDNGIYNGVRKVQTTSDDNGLFALRGGNGESLSLIPRKQGYALASDNTGFKYSHFYPESRHVPNPSQPVVIEMRKLQGAERLIHCQRTLYVPLDGSPVRLDLHTGTHVEVDGDIIIRVESSPVPNPTEKYDWKATIQVVQGGLAAASLELEKMYVAPESGYTPEFAVAYAKGSQPWKNGFTGAFYLKSRNGSSYGKLGLGINTDIVKNGAVFMILNTYVNPAGSRNLELDPALVAEARP